MKFRTTISAMLAAAGLAVATPVMAQEAVEPSDITAEEVTDTQVDAFVEALISLEELRVEYTPRMKDAETQEDREALAKEADAAAQELIADVDNITVADYLAIGQAARQDKALSKRINERIAEVQAE